MRSSRLSWSSSMLYSRCFFACSASHASRNFVCSAVIVPASKSVFSLGASGAHTPSVSESPRSSSLSPAAAPAPLAAPGSVVEPAAPPAWAAGFFRLGRRRFPASADRTVSPCRLECSERSPTVSPRESTAYPNWWKVWYCSWKDHSSKEACSITPPVPVARPPAGTGRSRR